MKRKLNAKQEAESLFIKDWCFTIIDFIYSKYKIDPSLHDMQKEIFNEETKRRYLEKASPAIYLKGLRQAYNDVNEMANDAPQPLLEDLNKILWEKFGKDLTTYSHSASNQVSKIVERGRIISDEEFRILERKVSELSQTDTHSSEIDKLNRLLLGYDIKNS